MNWHEEIEETLRRADGDISNLIATGPIQPASEDRLIIDDLFAIRDGIDLCRNRIEGIRMKAEMEQVAEWIDEALTHHNDDTILEKLRKTIQDFAKDFPLP